MHFSIYVHTGQLVKWVECSPMIREIGVQSQVETYQRLKTKMVLDAYLLNIYKVRWSNPVKGVAPSSILLWGSTIGQLIYIYIYIYIYGVSGKSIYIH